MNIENPRYIIIFLMYQKYILLKDILTGIVMKFAISFFLIHMLALHNFSEMYLTYKTKSTFTEFSVEIVPVAILHLGEISYLNF